MRAGSRYEDARTNGLGHVLEHMVFRGTATHPSSYAFNRVIEDLGGRLDATTQVDFTSFELEAPPESVLAGMAPFAEIFRSPTFADLETEKRILREEILEDLDEDGRDVDPENVARALLYGEHPLGYPITGSLANVASFVEGDLRELLARSYGARNMVLCIAGAVDPDTCIAEAAATFGPLPPGARIEATPPSLAAGAPRFRYVHDAGSQTAVRLEFPTFGQAHPDMRALELLGRVLDGGLSSRVQRRVIDELGLAYDAFASIDPYEDCGVFDLGASVAHDKAPEVVRELLGLVRALREETVPEEELARAQRRYLFDLRATLDHAQTVAAFHGESALFGLRGTLEDRADEVRSVTPEQLRRVARDLFVPEQARLACVGVLRGSLEKKTRAAME